MEVKVIKRSPDVRRESDHDHFPVSDFDVLEEGTYGVLPAGRPAR